MSVHRFQRKHPIRLCPPPTPENLRRHNADKDGIVWLGPVSAEMKAWGYSRVEARERLKMHASMLHKMLGLDARLRPDTVVYFVQAELTGLIKIGFSDAPERRHRDIASNAGPIKVLAQIPGGAARERTLHKRFAAFRRHGEWFEPRPSLLAYAERMRARYPLPEEIA